VQDHPEGGPPAKPRSGCAVVIAILASVLVAIPVVFSVRGLATECYFLHTSNAGTPVLVRQPCLVDVGRVIATIKICTLTVGVALLGGGIGWFVAARRHWPRRWPSAATGAFTTMSVLYVIYFFLALNALGRWSF